MSPRASLLSTVAVLLPLAAVAEEPVPSLSHDWSQMTENEKFCVVPSHQTQAACRWTGPTADEVTKAYRSRHYEKALAGFAEAARAGDTWGMWAEGVMYWFGHGVERDPARAFGLAKAAADLGDATADGLARQMSREMSGADLLRAERTTEEYLALGAAAERARRKWAAEQLGVVIDPAAIVHDADSPDCTGRIPDADRTATVRRSPQPDPINYPSVARMEGRSADTYVAGLVGRSGTLCRAQVIDSINGSSDIRSEILRRVQTWTFEAPRIDGLPIESLYLMVVRHRIKD